MWPSSSLPLTGSSAHNLLRTPANDNSTQNTCFSSHFIQIGLAQIAKNQGSNNEPPLYLLIKKVQLVYHYTYQYPHTPCRVHPVTCCQATPFEWIPLGLEPGLADPPQGEWPWKFGICESHGFFHGWMEVSTQDLGIASLHDVDLFLQFPRKCLQLRVFLSSCGHKNTHDCVIAYENIWKSMGCSTKRVKTSTPSVPRADLKGGRS